MAPKITHLVSVLRMKNQSINFDTSRNFIAHMKYTILLCCLFSIPSMVGQDVSVKTTCSISVDAGEDQTICDGETITLMATSANARECSTCTGYKIKNTKICNREEVGYVIWLSDENGKTKYFSNVDLEWKIQENGEATLKGTVRDVTDRSGRYNVDVILKNRTRRAPEGSPKDHQCYGENTSRWEYFTEFSGTISKADNSWTTNVSRRGPAFQLGRGANATEKKRGRFGGSGWFNTSDSKYTIGDFNINIGSCSSSETTNEVKYLWSNGETTPTITVSESGTYTVAVRDCKGCKDSDSVDVRIEDFSIDAGEDQTITIGNSAVLDPITDPDIERREWSVDGVVFFTTVSPSKSPTVSPTETTTYTVRAYKGGCVDEDTVTIFVAPCDFSVDLGEDRTICNNTPITLTANTSGDNGGGCNIFDLENTNFCSGINTYLVSLGDPQNRVYLVNESVQWQEIDDTTSEMKGTAVNSQDPSDTYEISVVFTQKTMTPPTDSPRLHGCSDGVDSSGWEYYQEFSGTIKSLTTDLVINVERRGVSFQVGKGANDTELISGKIGGSGWFSTDNATYTIGDFNFNLGGCLDSSDSLSYVWSTGETTPSIEIDEAGEYTVTVTNEDGCEATDTITVTSSEVAIDAGEDQTIILGDSVKLTPVAGADIVQWQVDGTVFFSTGSPSASPTVSPTETTTYTVLARFGECIVEDTVTITVLSCDDITIDAGNDITIDEGDSTRLDAIPGVEYREWSVDGVVFYTTVSPSKSPIVSPTETTTYTVTTTIGTCTIVDTVTVFVNECDLSADVGEDITICAGDEINLSVIVNNNPGIGEVQNTTICSGDPENYVLWLFNGEVNRYFSNIDLVWTEFDDGTATLVGTVLDYTVTNEVHNFEATFSGRTSALGDGSPRPSVCSNEINSEDWEYYTGITGTIDAIDGSWATTFSLRGPAFQIGAGANNTEAESGVSGASGWIETTDGEYTIGDINIVFSSGEVRFEWSTDESSQNIVVSPTENTVYTVTVTDENGCETTEEITVTVENCDTNSAAANSLKVYPTVIGDDNNPLTIELHSKSDQNVEIGLYSINGAKHSIIDDHLYKGDNMLYYNINKSKVIPAGIYLLIIKGEDFVRTSRIIKN